MLGVFPALATAGGVQRAGRSAAAVLTQIARSRGVPCRIFALNDPEGLNRIEFAETCFEVRGFGGHKIRFALEVLRAAHSAGPAYLGHPNLAPLGLVLKLLRRNRYIVASHGAEVWEPLPILRRVGLRFASIATAPSSHTAVHLRDVQSVKRTKIALIPWGGDPDFQCCGRMDPPDGLWPDRKILLTVARLAACEKQKGVEHVIEALPGVLKIVPSVHYVVIGDGDDRPRLERTAADCGVLDHVHFTGRLSDAEVRRHYRSCDAYVMPSLLEGFGLAFLEAMAFAKPVIGGNHGGTPDVIIDQVTGFLVEHGDVETLTRRILSLLTNEELRKAMGEAGRRRLEENYGFDLFRERLASLFANDASPDELGLAPILQRQ